VLGFRKELLRSTDRVLLVDDWIATGAQALAVQTLVEQAGATWMGTAVVIDALSDNQIRRQLQVRVLLREREL
jgi:adenine phosphoribosyltransferase